MGPSCRWEMEFFGMTMFENVYNEADCEVVISNCRISYNVE